MGDIVILSQNVNDAIDITLAGKKHFARNTKTITCQTRDVSLRSFVC